MNLSAVLRILTRHSETIFTSENVNACTRVARNFNLGLSIWLYQTFINTLSRLDLLLIVICSSSSVLLSLIVAVLLLLLM